MNDYKEYPIVNVQRAKTLRVRHGTADEFAAVNPVLKDTELGFDTTNNIIKLGDNVSTWSALPTLNAGGGGDGGDGGDGGGLTPVDLTDLPSQLYGSFSSGPVDEDTVKSTFIHLNVGSPNDYFEETFYADTYHGIAAKKAFVGTLQFTDIFISSDFSAMAGDQLAVTLYLVAAGKTTNAINIHQSTVTDATTGQSLGSFAFSGYFAEGVTVLVSIGLTASSENNLPALTDGAVGGSFVIQPTFE